MENPIIIVRGILAKSRVRRVENLKIDRTKMRAVPMCRGMVVVLENVGRWSGKNRKKSKRRSRKSGNVRGQVQGSTLGGAGVYSVGVGVISKKCFSKLFVFLYSQMVGNAWEWCFWVWFWRDSF